MKRAIAYLLLVLSFTVFVLCAIDDVTKLISDWRKQPSAMKHWWGADQFYYGDLYGFTYLSKFRVQNPTGPQVINPPRCEQLYPPKINLYALSDSYTWNVFKNPKNFCDVANSSYAASNFRDVLPVTLDKTKRNIVVIETTERNVRTLLSDSSYLADFLHIQKSAESTKGLPTAQARKQFDFNFRIKDNEPNYEFNLWDYAFFRPLKELKADVNYKWFNRINPDAAISPDGNYLFLGTTVDTTGTESSFTPILKKELDQLILILNGANDHYRKLGFDAVYLAIIPNPVTILCPNYKGRAYNNLIPKIQSRTDLKLTVFDTYSIFKSSKQKDRLYSHSDTHWTNVGRQLFVDSLNAQLQKDSLAK